MFSAGRGQVITKVGSREEGSDFPRPEVPDPVPEVCGDRPHLDEGKDEERNGDIVVPLKSK